MEFSKYNNQFGDLVDDADDFVIYESQVSDIIASSVCMVNIPKFCNLWCVHN